MWRIETLRPLVQKATSFRSLARLMGGVGNQTAKRAVLGLGLDTTHFLFGKGYLTQVGETYNRLTITKVWGDKSGNHVRWFCDCTCSCGAIVLRKRLDNVISGRVLSCGCASTNRESMLGMGNSSFSGYGELRGRKVAEIKVSAKRRGIEFKVTKKYLWDLFEKQGKRCALTGVELFFGRIHFPHETTASLDRIDSTRGYIEGNLQWVLKDVNKIKRDLDQTYLIRLCSLVTDYSRQGKNELPGGS